MYDHFAGGRNEYQSAFGWDRDGQWLIDSPIRSQLHVNENGNMDEYNIGFGFNISNFLFLGASISITDMDYKYSSFYDDIFSENIQKKGDYLYLENKLNTKGTAISANFGAILNLQVLRLGVAFNSPRYYDMTDYYGAWAETEIQGFDPPMMESNTPDGSYSEYRFRTPQKWIFSSAIVLGQSAIFSADYELTDYKKMQFADRNDDTGFPANDFIKEDYTFSHTIKLGAEVKPTPRFALRAGYMMQTSPMREALTNNDVEVLPAGTIPHFTVTSKPTHYYTAGLGYRFTPNFYMDLALVYRANKASAYAFSNTYSNREAVEIYAEPAKLKNKTTRLALTLGYKF
jgi:long-subunit fatty acid transport protein